MMPDDHPITSRQKNRISGLISDESHQVLTGVSQDTAQRVMEAGDQFPEASKSTLLNLGPKPDDIRVTQAKVWWEKVISRTAKPKFHTFEAYLATVPEVPQSLVSENTFLPLLTLGDSTVLRTERAKLIGVKHAEFGYRDDTLVPFDSNRPLPREPHWFRAHDGRPNRGKRADEFRRPPFGKFLPGNADVGLSLFLQHPGVAVKDEHVMDLPASVHCGDRSGCAYLGVWDFGPRLGAYLGAEALPTYGTVVYRLE